MTSILEYLGRIVCILEKVSKYETIAGTKLACFFQKKIMEFKYINALCNQLPFTIQKTNFLTFPLHQLKPNSKTQ